MQNDAGLVAYSCVVDDHPRFHMQAWVWLCTLARVSSPEALRIIFHIGPAPDHLADAAAHFGADIEIIAGFGDGPAVYCNKLQPFDRLLQTGAEYLVLSDADIAFLGDPADWIRPGCVRAKPVDRANPPAEILADLLRRAGMEEVALDAEPDFQPGTRTHSLNCNGGIYVLARDALERLTGPWRRWARFCLGHGALLGPYLAHADQLGFLLAMLETGTAFDPLPAAANFPLHFPARLYGGRDWPRPLALHYHGALGKDGALAPVGAPGPDAAVAAANLVLTEAAGSPGHDSILAHSTAGSGSTTA